MKCCPYELMERVEYWLDLQLNLQQRHSTHTILPTLLKQYITPPE